MSRYVTDTQAVLWYLSADKRLSRRAHVAFLHARDGLEQILVPSIVLVEAVFLLQRQRLPSDAIARLLALPESPEAGITVYPLTAAVARECHSFGPAAIPEMPDRVIAARARHLGLPLLSSNPIIQASQLVTTIW